MAFYPVWGQLSRIINFSLHTDFLNKLNRKSGNKSKNNKLLNLIYLSTGRIKTLSKSSITYLLQLPNLNYIYKDGTKSNIKYSNFGKNRISRQISTKIFCTHNRRYLVYDILLTLLKICQTSIWYKKLVTFTDEHQKKSWRNIISRCMTCTFFVRKSRVCWLWIRLIFYD